MQAQNLKVIRLQMWSSLGDGLGGKGHVSIKVRKWLQSKGFPPSVLKCPKMSWQLDYEMCAHKVDILAWGWRKRKRSFGDQNKRVHPLRRLSSVNVIEINRLEPGTIPDSTLTDFIIQNSPTVKLVKCFRVFLGAFLSTFQTPSFCCLFRELNQSFILCSACRNALCICKWNSIIISF